MNLLLKAGLALHAAQVGGGHDTWTCVQCLDACCAPRLHYHTSHRVLMCVTRAPGSGASCLHDAARMACFGAGAVTQVNPMRLFAAVELRRVRVRVPCPCPDLATAASAAYSQGSMGGGASMPCRSHGCRPAARKQCNPHSGRVLGRDYVPAVHVRRCSICPRYTCSQPLQACVSWSLGAARGSAYVGIPVCRACKLNLLLSQS